MNKQTRKQRYFGAIVCALCALCVCCVCFVCALCVRACVRASAVRACVRYLVGKDVPST